MNIKDSSHKGMLFVVATVVLSACAQLFMKFGMLSLTHIDHASLQSFHLSMLNLNTVLWVLVGLTCYAVSMLFWLAALAKYELSFAYPLLSLSYVLVYLGAIALPGFNENISWLRSLGIIVIIIGVTLVTRTKSDNLSMND